MAFPTILKFDRLVRSQSEANDLLQGAILNERASSWNKVVDKYKRLLKLIAKCNLPASFSAPPSYDHLMYESYYHLGVAFQNLGRHKEAVHAYTNAMLSMNLRKNGCTAGCNSNSCFHTPVLAKRGFAHAKSGDLKSAFRDVEKAVVLDTHNPDLYCLRALLWNTRKDNQKAIDDLDRALTFNPKHVCALMLRGATDQPLQMTFGLLEGISPNKKKELHRDHKRAVEISPDASAFLDISPDVHGPKIIKFWNRFLWSLNVPRTVMHVDLTSSVITQYNTTIAMNEQAENRGPNRPTTATPSATQQRLRLSADRTQDRPQSNPLPFRCGTPLTHMENKGHAVQNRRLSYGEAVRTYKTLKQDTGVSEYVQRLVAHASRPPSSRKPPSGAKTPTITVTRPPSISLHPPPRSESRVSSITFADQVRPAPGNSPSPQPLVSLTPPTLGSRRGSQTSIHSCPVTFDHSKSRLSVGSRLPPSGKRRASLAVVRGHSEASNIASKLHGLGVFNSVDVTDVPRMYYKPWGGDKLPVAELPTRNKLGAFRV